MSLDDYMAGGGTGGVAVGAMMAQGVVSGAQSKISNAIGVGVHIGNSILDAVTSVLGAAGGVVSRVGHLVGDLLVKAVTLAVGAAAAVLGGLIASTIATVKQSQAILNASQQSGRGLGGTARAFNNLSGLGVDPGSVGGLQKDVFTQGIIARAHGVRGDVGSREFMDSYRDRYQGLYNSGPMGRMRAGAMERSMGTESLRGAALLSQPSYDKQMQRSQSMQNALGMSPGEIRAASTSLVLFNASLGQFIGLVRDRIVAAALPLMTRALDSLVDKLSKNAGGIGKAIDSAMERLKGIGRFLYADLPVYFANGIDMAMGAVSKGMDWLSVAFVTVQDMFATVAAAATDFANSPLVQTLLNLAKASASVSGGVRDAAVNAGASPAVANAAGAAAVVGGGLLARGAVAGVAGMAGRALFGTAAGAAGATAATVGGSVSAFRWAGPLAGLNRLGDPSRLIAGIGKAARVVTNPFVAVPAIGATAGALGYTALQRSGALGKDAPGFWEALSNTRGRIWAGITTGHASNYDKMVNENWRREAEQKKKDAVAAGQKQAREDAVLAGPKATVNNARAEFHQWQAKNIGTVEQRRADYDKAMLEELRAIHKDTTETKEHTARLKTWGALSQELNQNVAESRYKQAFT